nr:hypothetical protein [Tanacetum cinerariifolium]
MASQRPVNGRSTTGQRRSKLTDHRLTTAVYGGDRRSMVAVNDGLWWRTIVDHRRTPPDHRSMTGVDTYDVSTKDNFNLRVVVLWTINDYLALENQEDTRGRGGKIQKQKRNTTEEEGSSSQVNGQNGAYWKKFNIWYRKLRYWRHNSVPYCIDFMHVEKNVAESLVETLIHVPRKMKDGVNARLDLAELGVKPELFAMQEEDKATLPPAGYTLKNAKKDTFCDTKEIIMQELDKMQAELVVTLCPLEKFFPPSFFDIMIHLTVHLSREVKLCGLICFRWMYPVKRCMKVIKGHVQNKNKPKGCVVEETIAKETIEFFSEYHKSIETIGIPPDKHEIGENEEGKPLRHKQVLKTENPSKRITFLENERSKSFAKWLRKEVERKLAISEESVSKIVRWVSYGPRAILVKYDAYNINGAGGVIRDTLGYTLIDLNNLGHKFDSFILALQARQVFYVKDQIDKKLSIVFKTPPKNYKDTYDKVDEEFSIVIHQRNDNILPRVNQRDLGNESRDDYYRTDCGDSSSDNNNSDSYSTSQISTLEEIDYDSPEQPKSLLTWYHYLSDEYKDNGRFWGSKSRCNESGVEPSWKDIEKAKVCMLAKAQASEASSKAKLANAKTWDAIKGKTFGVKIPPTMTFAKVKIGKRNLKVESDVNLLYDVMYIGLLVLIIIETQAIDDQDPLVNYDNDNENDDLGYQSEDYFDKVQEDDENNHSNRNVVGITRLYKFHMEYGKPDEIKLSVTFDALNMILGKHRASLLSFLGDMRYFDVDLTVRKLIKNRLGQLLRDFRRKLRQTYILPNQNTLSKLNEVPTKYSAILKAEDWVNFVKSKKIEPDEEPARGTLWLKGRVNKDGEYPDDEIRSVGDKLKETKDKIKEGTLKVDHGTDAMIVVLGKEKGGYARGVGSGVTYNSADEEGGTTVVGCENDANIQKSNGLATLEKEMKTRVSNTTSPCETVKYVGSKKMTRSIRKDSSRQDSQSQENVSPLLVLPQACTVYKTDGKQILHNKELPKDCYKVSIDPSLVDAACIPNVGYNSFKTAKDTVGGFFAWLKDQVVFDPMKKESAAKDALNAKKDGMNAEKDGVNAVQEGDAGVNEEPEDMLEEETFTQWIDKNIDWVGEDDLFAWPRAVQPITVVCPQTPQRVVTHSSFNKSIVKPSAYLNSPYMNKRTKVIPLIKSETVYQTCSGHDLSSVHLNMETLAPRLWIDANVIDCWVAILNHEELVRVAAAVVAPCSAAVAVVVAFLVAATVVVPCSLAAPATGSENRPPMLNKENYVPWSFRLLRYAKSRPNGKLIHNSIINDPYVRRMISEPGDLNCKVLVNETFHVQTDDELTEKKLKHIKADDQAIRTILLGLPEDIYADVDSHETAQEIWL